MCVFMGHSVDGEHVTKVSVPSTIYFLYKVTLSRAFENLKPGTRRVCACAWDVPKP